MFDAKTAKAKFKQNERKIWGEHTMEHANVNFPKEFWRLRWAFDLTAAEHLLIAHLRAVNSWERAIKGLPTTISQTELARQWGCTQQNISKLITHLRVKKFECPFCEFKWAGLITTVEPTANEIEDEGPALRVWITGFVEALNHLAGHYNTITAKDTAKDKAGQRLFKQIRDTWLELQRRKGKPARQTGTRKVWKPKEKEPEGKVILFPAKTRGYNHRL